MGGGISSNIRTETTPATVTRIQSPEQSIRASARSAPRQVAPTPAFTTSEWERTSPSNNDQGSASPVNAEVSLAIAFTPRENEKTSAASSFSGVPYTPHGDEASVFKYYCPLCMQYFKQILKTKCCSNYLCVQCCKDYVSTKGIKMAPNDGIAQIENQLIDSNTIYCPHCQVSGFHPIGVNSEEVVRDYQSSFVPQNHHSVAAYSPLRVGETFEDLKRKMIPFKSFNTTSTANDDAAQDEQVQPYDPLSPLSMMHAGTAPGIAGIAMLSGAGDETPTLRSPRMRLAPDTPGQMSFSLYNPDYSGRGSHFGDDRDRGPDETNGRLFSDEHSDQFAAHDQGVADESKSGDDANHYTPTPVLFDLCSGCDSPRVGSERRGESAPGSGTPERHLEEVPRTVPMARPPLSRVNSTPRVVEDMSRIPSSRIFDTDGDTVHGEKGRLQSHCNNVAAGMVDHMVRSALAEYASNAAVPIASQ